MKLLFHLGHPAHFHLFKNTILKLKSLGHDVDVLIKKKDILENLIRDSGIEYSNILPEGRKDSKIGLLLGMIKRDLRLLKFCLSKRPQLLVGTSIEIGHVGTLLGIPSLNVNEDDADVVPLYAKISYPFSTKIVSPRVCNNGQWESKSIKYEGYHELAYLHPEHFEASREIASRYVDLDKPIFLIRFAKLNAHHDEGVRGISNDLAKKVVDLLKQHGQVYITSERPLNQELESYRLPVDPLDIHHVMAFASLYIGDSQTMAAESGVLGVPFVRFNDFVGRIGYLDELENTYELGFGIKPDNEEKLIQKLEFLMDTKDLKIEFQRRRAKMLEDKINVADFLLSLILGFNDNK